MELGEEVDAEKVLIYKGPQTLILANWFEDLIKHSELKWNYDEILEGYFLTLKEISDQLESLGFNTTFTVIQEDSLSGEIYTYGIYNPKSWILSGKTIGYA